MTKNKKVLLFAALFVVTAAVVAALTMPVAAPPASPWPPCEIVLCQAPPPTCPPGYKLAVPAGQCCPVCVRSR